MQFTDEDLIRWLQVYGHITHNDIKAWEAHKRDVLRKERERMLNCQKNNLCCVCDNPGYPYCPAHEV